jgi:serine/threonine protein kinase
VGVPPETVGEEGVRYDDAGRRIQLIRPLGRGGFSTVWRARLQSVGGLERDVALKLLEPDEESESAQQSAARLLDEAAVLTRLCHPVIVTAHDLTWLDGKPALVTEYVEGADLQDLLQDEEHPLPRSVLLEVVAQIAGALDAAYSTCGIVHRDVKPQNVRVARLGHAKLLDFGIARAQGIARQADPTNGVVGSLRYLAPERLVPGHPLDPASDVFSLGAVLYEGLVGEPLFDPLEIPTIIRLLRLPDELGTFVTTRLRKVGDEDLRALLASMLAHGPHARPTAAAVASRCEQLFGSQPEPITLRAWCRAHPWPAEAPVEASEPIAPDPTPSPSLPETELLARPARPGALALAETELRDRPCDPPASELPTRQLPRKPAPAPTPTPTAARDSARWLGLGLGAGVTLMGAALAGVLGLGVLLALLQSGPDEPVPPPALTLPARPELPIPVTEPPRGPSAPDPAPVEAGPIGAGPIGAGPGEADPPPLVRVTFAGPVGATAFLDGVALGETNISYEVPVGEHTCGAGFGAPAQTIACSITPESRAVRLPPLGPP